MGVGISIDIDERFTEDLFMKCLPLSEIYGFNQEDGNIQGRKVKKIWGNFKDSNLYFIGTWPSLFPEVAIENMEKQTWKAGASIYFKYYMRDYERSNAEIAAFIKKISSICPAYFVASFQHEELYAIKNEKGLKILNPQWLQ